MRFRVHGVMHVLGRVAGTMPPGYENQRLTVNAKAKRMRNLCVLITVAAATLAPKLHAGLTYGGTGTVTLTQGALSYGDGGVFYASSSSSLGNFQTFCIEDQTYFAPGAQYNYLINSGAIAGGASGADAINSFAPYAGATMDNISWGTAWLYSQFRAGNLGVTTAQAAGNLQAAIWYLEGETSLTPGNGANGTAYFDLAVNALASTLHISTSSPGIPNVSGIFSDSHGAYGVVALNLFDPNNSDGLNGYSATTIDGLRQDQLAIVPVPEPTTLVAGAMLLLPFGASTLRFVRKDRAT